MPKANVQPKKGNKKPADGFYKGYDIKWLKGLGNEHPAFPLVAEYEAKFGEVK